MGVKDLVQWYTDELEASICRSLGEPVPEISTAPTPRPSFTVPVAAMLESPGAADQLPA